MIIIYALGEDKGVGIGRATDCYGTAYNVVYKWRWLLIALTK